MFDRALRSIPSVSERREADRIRELQQALAQKEIMALRRATEQLDVLEELESTIVFGRPQMASESAKFSAVAKRLDLTPSPLLESGRHSATPGLSLLSPLTLKSPRLVESLLQSPTTSVFLGDSSRPLATHDACCSPRTQRRNHWFDPLAAYPLVVKPIVSLDDDVDEESQSGSFGPPHTHAKVRRSPRNGSMRTLGVRVIRSGETNVASFDHGIRQTLDFGTDSERGEEMDMVCAKLFLLSLCFTSSCSVSCFL